MDHPIPRTPFDSPAAARTMTVGYVNSTPPSSNHNSPVRTPPGKASTSAGTIRIPPLSVVRRQRPAASTVKTMMQEVFGSDDEWEEEEYCPTHIPMELPRRIAGSRRVAKARENALRNPIEYAYQQQVAQYNNPMVMDQDGPEGSVKASEEVFQSITAHPSYAGLSFEELRHECYKQAKIITGNPPLPATPQWMTATMSNPGIGAQSPNYSHTSTSGAQTPFGMATERPIPPCFVPFHQHPTAADRDVAMLDD